MSIVPPSPDRDEKDPRRSADYLLSLRAFVILLVALGIGLACVHHPTWAAAVLAAVAVLGIMIKVIGS